MKLYLIQWGYYSSNDGGSELDSIWANKDNAIKYLQDKAIEDHLEKYRSKKGIEDSNCYTDGDYWISISEVNSDTRWMYGEPDET